MHVYDVGPSRPAMPWFFCMQLYTTFHTPITIHQISHTFHPLLYQVSININERFEAHFQISTFNFNIFQIQLFVLVTERDQLRDVKKLARVDERGYALPETMRSLSSPGRRGEDI